jgi:hypothetical protein
MPSASPSKVPLTGPIPNTYAQYEHFHSIGDVVNHRLWQMQQECAALRDYIQTV